MSPAKPLPTPDRDSEPFWQALRERQLRLQRCSGCGELRFPPREVCNVCFSFDAQWQELSGRGRVVSWVRTHQVFAPAYRLEVPYVSVQVALAEQGDVQLIGGWHGAADPCVGELVRARFVDASDWVLLDWAPAELAART